MSMPDPHSSLPDEPPTPVPDEPSAPSGDPPEPDAVGEDGGFLSDVASWLSGAVDEVVGFFKDLW